MTLTSEQILAVTQGQPIAVVVNETDCILIRKDIYQQMSNLPLYDDSDWTEAEISALAAQTFAQLDAPEPIR